MKKITIAFFIFLCFDNAFSTGQQQDIIFYNNSKAKLTIEVACPSPLELYFKQTKQENPFTMLHTANSRGHVATWKINHNTLFLKKINRPGDIIDLKMIFPNMPVKNPIKATWFSGYILIKAKPNKENTPSENGGIIPFKEYTIAKIEKGNVTATQTMTGKEYMKAYNCIYLKKNCSKNKKGHFLNDFYEYTKRIRKANNSE